MCLLLLLPPQVQLTEGKKFGRLITGLLDKLETKWGSQLGSKVGLLILILLPLPLLLSQVRAMSLTGGKRSGKENLTLSPPAKAASKGKEVAKSPLMEKELARSPAKGKDLARSPLVVMKMSQEGEEVLLEESFIPTGNVDFTDNSIMNRLTNC